MQPFIARFLLLIARTDGLPPFRVDGGGSLSVLYVSNIFKNRNAARRMGTINGIVGNDSEGLVTRV